MSHLKDLIVNGVARVLGKLVANEVETGSIKASSTSNQAAYKTFATNGTIQGVLQSVSTTGSGTVVTAVSASNGQISVTKGSTPMFVQGSITSSAVLVGGNSIASGEHSVAEGYSTTASGSYSHTEGIYTNASNDNSHVEGSGSVGSGFTSHAEGSNTTASGSYSHAEGSNTTASGSYSHAGGYYTIANKDYQTSIGKFNSGSVGLFIIGNGSGLNTRSNAFRVDEYGATYGVKAYNTGGADYAEYFEWEDGNSNNEDRIGHFVALDRNGKIKLASIGDKILGVISGNASVVGNAFEDTWSGMYLHDVYGRPILEEIERELDLGVDEEGNPQKRTIKLTVQKLNPDYDPTKPYIPRSQRPEWDVVGLLGQLIVIDDGTCEVGSQCSCNDQGIATSGDRYDVIKRLDESHVVILASFLS